MGLRGPKPRPTKILQLHGSRQVETRRLEPTPAIEAPACPAWLTTPEQHALWQHLVTQLMAIGVLAKIDQLALARYVLFVFRWRELEDFIQSHGVSFVSDNGVIHAYPEAKLAMDLAMHLNRLEQSFGMTPSARARVFTQAQVPGEGDAFEAFVAPVKKRKA